MKNRHFLKLTDQPIINNYFFYKMIMSSFVIVRNFHCFLNLSVALHTGCSSFFTASVVVASALGRPATIEKKPLTLKSIHSTSIFTLEEHQVGPLMRASPPTKVDQVRISASTSYVVCYTAVFSVVTHARLGEERCVSTLKTAVQQTTPYVPGGFSFGTLVISSL